VKKEIADKWVAALRSGDYDQTRSTLRSEDCSGYCCLGVLTDLYAIENNIKFEDVGGEQYGSGCGLIAKPVHEWSGIANWKTVSASDGSLASLNDGYASQFYKNRDTSSSVKIRGAYTFKEIADHIEKNYESL
jgi:hypothetical protein